MKKEIYKTVQYNVQNFIERKKKKKIENKLTGMSVNLKTYEQFSKAPFKSGGCIVTSVLENYIIRDDTSQILKTFKPNKKCWRQNFPSFLINTQLILFLIIKKTCNVFKFQSGSNS